MWPEELAHGFRPAGRRQGGADLKVAHSLDALADVDVIYLLRMQKERHESSNFLPSLREYIARYQVGLRHLSGGQKVLHPGPINRGVEIEGALADSTGNLILQQVEAGLAVRMAVMYRLIVDSAAADSGTKTEHGTAPEKGRTAANTPRPNRPRKFCHRSEAKGRDYSPLTAQKDSGE